MVVCPGSDLNKWLWVKSVAIPLALKEVLAIEFGRRFLQRTLRACLENGDSPIFQTGSSRNLEPVTSSKESVTTRNRILF